VSQNANYGRIIHEIGHAVGLIHEHSRTDRDNYIKMNWINIYGNFPKDFMQFWKMGSSKFIEGFDFNSVMLYSSKIMNSSGKEVVVMTKLNGDTWEGQRACLSPGDLNIIEELYGANAKKRPVISTDIPGDIKELSATLNGNVVFDGGKNITSRGFAWCKAGSGLYKIELVDGSTGKFSFSFSGLQPNTEYLFYAFASNSNGTTTGDLIRFTTKATANEPSSVTFNGYTYKTVKTGTQWWFAENLQTTQYSDGTAIPNVTDNNSWLNLTTGAYCWYNNDIANKAVYGALYNWYAVNTGKLCPSGWHVPTDAEWKTLEMSLGMTQAQSDQTGWRGTNQGTQMKSTNGWYNNGNGSNSSGFSGLPGGYRIYNGTFGSVGSFGYWWSSTELSSPLAWYRYLYYYYPDVARTTNNKQYGFSVRCIRD
jgi:uncharacterized protein (TIGR02145 family)